MVPPSKLFFSNKLRPSITNMKSSGDRGKPCQTPLALLKNFVAFPLINTAYEEDVIHDMIQLAKCIPNLIFKRINLRRSQSMQS